MQLFCGISRNPCRFFCTAIRSYASNARPVEMSSKVFEGSHTNKTKPPVLIMHGLFGSKQNWRTVARTLMEKTDRKIITVDARNHGDSPHTNEHNSLCMSLDIIHLMKQHGIQKSTVIGHSMGGRTMMFLALKFPEYVSDGVIVDISPLEIPRDFSQMEQIFLALKNIQIPGYLSMAEGRKYAEIKLKNAVDQKETIDFILLNLRKKNGSFSWAVNVEGLHENIPHFDNFPNQIEGFEPYRGKIMFICGNQSNFVDPKSWPRIQKYFPNSEIHWLDAGHLVHFDQPVEFVGLLVRFLNNQ